MSNEGPGEPISSSGVTVLSMCSVSNTCPSPFFSGSVSVAPFSSGKQAATGEKPFLITEADTQTSSAAKQSVLDSSYMIKENFRMRQKTLKRSLIKYQHAFMISFLLSVTACVSNSRQRIQPGYQVGGDLPEVGDVCYLNIYKLDLTISYHLRKLMLE